MTEEASKMEEDTAPAPPKEETKKASELDAAQIRAKIENAKSLAKQASYLFPEARDRILVHTTTDERLHRHSKVMRTVKTLGCCRETHRSLKRLYLR
jgi:hypothetical protein